MCYGEVIEVDGAKKWVFGSMCVSRSRVWYGRVMEGVMVRKRLFYIKLSNSRLKIKSHDDLKKSWDSLLLQRSSEVCLSMNSESVWG